MEHNSIVFIVFNSIVFIFYLLQFSNVRKCHEAEQLNRVRAQVPHLPTQLKWSSGTAGPQESSLCCSSPCRGEPNTLVTESPDRAA